MFCGNCGEEVDNNVSFCPHCGASVSGTVQVARQNTESKIEHQEKRYRVSSKNRVVAMLLACLGFFGIAGLHRMYVGKKGSAFLYLFTCGILFFGTAYDIYQIYTEKFKDGDGYPLYSDGSMQPNYYRKAPKAVGVIAKLVYGFFCLAIFVDFMVVMNAPAHQQQQAQEQQESKENKHQSELPIIDLPMDGTPEQNIKNTVEKNFDSKGNSSDLTLTDVKVTRDKANNANVTISLHGARTFTVNLMMGEFNHYIKKEIAALYQVKPGVDISNVSVTVFMDVTNTGTGEKRTIPAYTLSMSRDKAKTMHWDNYKEIDIMDAASKIEMDPAFEHFVKKNANKSSFDQIKDAMGI